MRLTRVFVDGPLTRGSTLRLERAASEHLLRVLRLREGAALVLFNGDGLDYAGLLKAVDGKDAIVEVGAAQEPGNESPLPLLLAQGIARGERMDLVLQKATELGVTAIQPLDSERCEVRLSGERLTRRMAHWTAVLRAACGQCGRARVPRLERPMQLLDWTQQLAPDTRLRLRLSPDAPRRLSELDIPAAGVVLAVGPEGGFGPGDVRALDAAGFVPARLGPRVLRTETAGLAALAALQLRAGDF